MFFKAALIQRQTCCGDTQMLSDFCCGEGDDRLGWALIGRGADNAQAPSRLRLLGGPELGDGA